MSCWPVCDDTLIFHVFAALLLRRFAVQWARFGGASRILLEVSGVLVFCDNAELCLIRC